MRVFIATLGTETNTFATYPTGIEAFRGGFWSEAGVKAAAPDPAGGPATVWLEEGRRRGWEVIEGLHGFAPPSGIVLDSAYEEMRDRILSDLQAAGQVDMVLLYLHGAMIAESYDDCEADLVARVRELAGPGVTIGVELDLHAHLDQALLDASDVIVFFKAYPHIDYNDRAAELFDLAARAVAGEITPVMALHECRVMGLFPTTPEGPMKTFVAEMMAAEGRDGVLSLSLNHGFPWADSPVGGAKMLAVTDGDPRLAARTARAFGEKFQAIAPEAALRFTPFEEALELAAQPGELPVLLADVSDQSGSGAPGDTAHMARALVERGFERAVYGPIWDPSAIAACFAVGEGRSLHLRIGGKAEPQSGPPLDLMVEIRHLARDAIQTQEGLEPVALGDLAVVRHKGVEIVLTGKRVNVFDPSFFTRHVVSLADKQVVGIKNLYKHTDTFAPLVRAQYYVATPGVSQPDFSRLDYKRLPRPIWPFDPVLGVGGGVST